jgi:hypothetical protein
MALSEQEILREALTQLRELGIDPILQTNLWLPPIPVKSLPILISTEKKWF